MFFVIKVFKQWMFGDYKVLLHHCFDCLSNLRYGCFSSLMNNWNGQLGKLILLVRWWY